MAPMRLAAVAGAALACCARACTIIAVGKDASSSGFPMVTHADDSGPSPSDVRLVRVPAKKHKKGAKRPLYLWQIPYPRVVAKHMAPEYAPVKGQKTNVPLGYIDEVEETYAYWDTDYGVQNEHGLSIGESTCTAMTVGWPAAPDKPYGYNKAGIDELSKIALERCKTARCAVQTMGDIAVQEGFYSADAGEPNEPAYSGSSEGLVVADAEPGEVWIFNVLTGRNNASAIWAAQRVPTDHVLAVGNSFTIRRLNLSDAENNLYSPHVTDLAREMGWWMPEDEPSPDLFDFFGAYGYQPPAAGGLPWEPKNTINILRFYSGRRMWRVFSLLSPEEGAKLDPNKGNVPKTPNPYPPSVPAPRGSVTLEMVMNAHRDHYEGTPYDLTKGMSAGPFGDPNRQRAPKQILGQWERAISMYRTSYSFVLVPRPHKRSLVWFGYDSAHGTAYLPFYGAATGPAPKAWRTGVQSKFSFDCAWWPFQLVNEYSELNFAQINAEVREKASTVEAEAFKKVEEWEKKADKLKEEEALELLTKHSNEFAEKILNEWWELLYHLWGKYARWSVTWNESEAGENWNGQEYPAEWLNSPDVGFSSWTPTLPHGTPEVGCPTQAAATLRDSGSGAGPAVAVVVALVAVAVAAYSAGVKQGRGENEDIYNYVRQP